MADDATPNPNPTDPTPNPAPAAKPADPAPAPAAADPAKAAAPAAPKLVTLTEDAYLDYLEAKRKVREIAAEKDAELEEKEQARLKALAEKGEGVKAMEEYRERTEKDRRKLIGEKEALESEILTGHRDRELSRAIPSTVFVSDDAVQQFAALMEPRFEAARDASGRPTVREKGTGRAPADAVKEFLSLPAYAHFLKAEHRGGSGAGRSDTTPAAAANRTLPFDQALVEAMKNRARPADASYGLALPSGIVTSKN